MKTKILAILLSLSLYACQNKQSYDIYLCIGQSNMAGRATIIPIVEAPLKNVFLLTNDTANHWEIAENPLNKYSTIRKSLRSQKLGPSYGFAQALQQAQPRKKIGLVVNAKGGASIRSWHPDSLFFKEAVRRTQTAMEHGQLKGIIWHQGCTDVENWDSYMPLLERMVSELRHQLGEDIPFVAGQLSLERPRFVPFNKMILTTPKHIPNSAVVSSKGLTTIGRTHFDTQSQLTLGQRYAEEMRLLQGK